MNRPFSAKFLLGKSLFLLNASIFAAVTLHAQSSITVQDPWVRIPAPSKSDTAMFMVIENHSAQPKAVVALSTTAAEKAEMHEMKMVESKEGSAMPGMGKKQSMMMMSPVAKIVIPANGKATLAPGGLHIMLFGLKSKVADGDKISVTLKLDDGSEIPVSGIVRKTPGM